jgi:neurofibromin 1
MVCNILNFLDASPMSLFEGPPSEGADRASFYVDNFSSIISCVVAANESVRRLAAAVARRLFKEEAMLRTLREFHGLDSARFKSKFWRLRYVRACPPYGRDANRTLKFQCTIICL